MVTEVAVSKLWTSRFVRQPSVMEGGTPISGLDSYLRAETTLMAMLSIFRGKRTRMR